MMPEKNRMAIAAEGGGFRTIFCAGVLDAFLAAQFDPFDLYVGVSGGAMNLSSFVSRQYKRNFNIITEIGAHPDFLSARRYLSGGDYLGLDLLVDISNDLYPFDFDQALATIENKDFVIVCTDVDSGEAIYIRPQRNNWTEYLKASGALPIVTRNPIELDGRRFLDGAFSDPLPVEKTLELGADKIVFIRTRPVRLPKSSYESVIGAYLYKNFPMFKENMRKNCDIYNASADKLNHPPAGIQIMQIAPDEPLMCGRTTQTVETLERDYRLGLEKGLDFLERFKK